MRAIAVLNVGIKLALVVAIVFMFTHPDTRLFTVEASPSDLASDTSIGLQREYSAGGRVTTEFVQADVVQVTIRYSLGATPFNGCYQVTDKRASAGGRDILDLE